MVPSRKVTLASHTRSDKIGRYWNAPSQGCFKSVSWEDREIQDVCTRGVGVEEVVGSEARDAW